MAPRTVTFLLLQLVATVAMTEANSGKLKRTDMVFYMHHVESGGNVTAVPVAGVPQKRWWNVEFGTLYACDDPLTEEYDHSSTQVGRAQGLYVNSALDVPDLHLLMSLVFTNRAYNGSTLEIQGADRIYQRYREVSVVSGTGIFRLARGYATLETVYLDLAASNAIIRWNLTVFHY